MRAPLRHAIVALRAAGFEVDRIDEAGRHTEVHFNDSNVVALSGFIAAVAYPWRSKEIYERSSGSISERGHHESRPAPGTRSTEGCA